jgi:phosphatidylserine/phosphatidylglycerophosphate/cardiolipin synthase-like enzyme
MKPKALLVAGLVGLVNDEAYSLTLLDVVETNNTDVAVRVFATALTDFVEDFLSRSSIEKGQLPKSPVVKFRGGFLLKLNPRNEALIHHELDLTSDLLVTEGGKVGESFVTLLFR